jgi:hypothetical protein
MNVLEAGKCALGKSGAQGLPVRYASRPIEFPFIFMNEIDP